MTTAAQPSAQSVLQRSVFAHEALVAHVLRIEARRDDETTLRWLSFVASAAWSVHPGRFMDERLEAVALRIGQRLGACRTSPERRRAGPRRVLHVATSVYEVGGHTRLIENWVSKDKGAMHSLILIDQDGYAIRERLATLVTASNGELIALPAGLSLLDRARRLRNVAWSGYDFVILHHHPNDVVPTVSLAVAKGPPVAVMNHADHVFWLGASVADAVIEFRDYGRRLTGERRGVPRSMMLPLPIAIEAPMVGRAEARAALGIPDGEVALLSIGAAYKYAPKPPRDFFRTMHKVLADSPNARLYVIGVGPDDLRSFGVPTHQRIEALGPVNDPSLHEAAADLYLEGFPLNSYTALLETAARGVCPVLMYAPSPPLDLSGEAALHGLITAAADERDYVARIKALIANPAARSHLGAAVAERIAAIHGTDFSAAYLEPIYHILGGLEHRPTPPPSPPDAVKAEDLDRIAFKAGHGIRTVLVDSAPVALAGLRTRDLVHAARLSWRYGDTRLTPLHLRNWFGVFRQAARPRRRWDDAKA